MKTVTIDVRPIAESLGDFTQAWKSGKASLHAAHTAMQQGTGVVKAVKAGKMQIAHDPIPSLQWPAMTMWFELKDRAGHSLKVGDRVHFGMTQGEDKKWVIKKIEKR